jgi:hypothetical protein
MLFRVSDHYDALINEMNADVLAIFGVPEEEGKSSNYRTNRSMTPRDSQADWYYLYMSQKGRWDDLHLWLNGNVDKTWLKKSYEDSKLSLATVFNCVRVNNVRKVLKARPEGESDWDRSALTDDDYDHVLDFPDQPKATIADQQETTVPPCITSLRNSGFAGHRCVRQRAGGGASDGFMGGRAPPRRAGGEQPDPRGAHDGFPIPLCLSHGPR